MNPVNTDEGAASEAPVPPPSQPAPARPAEDSAAVPPPARFGRRAKRIAAALIAVAVLIAVAARVGPAYLFAKPTLVLQSPDGHRDFGDSVVASDRYVVQRSPGWGGEEKSAVYVFDAATGALARKLHPPKLGKHLSYVAAVAIEGTRIVVGTSDGVNDGSVAEFVYLFDAETGSLLRIFKADIHDGPLEISGRRVLLGTGFYYDYGACLFDTETGSVPWQSFLFNTGNRSEPTFRFDSPILGGGDLFGWKISISGDNVLVGAMHDNTGAPNAGRAYLYEAATGALVATLNNPVRIVKILPCLA